MRRDQVCVYRRSINIPGGACARVRRRATQSESAALYRSSTGSARLHGPPKGDCLARSPVHAPISGAIDKIPCPVPAANHVFRVSRPLQISTESLHGTWPGEKGADFRWLRSKLVARSFHIGKNRCVLGALFITRNANHAAGLFAGKLVVLTFSTRRSR